MVARLHKAATLHLLLVGVFIALSTTGTGAQMAFFPNCNFQEVTLAPCMAAGAGGNISGACCSSLNRALDAGHRCVCSLLLANPVFASLVTNLLTLPLPGCFLYAPSLAACQATTVQQQTSAPPAATSVVPSTGGAARVADPPTIPAAAVASSLEKTKGAASPEKADEGRSTAGNGTSEAAPPPRVGQSVSRSNPCRRHPGNAGQGTAAYAVTFLTAAAVSWINCIAVP